MDASAYSTEFFEALRDGARRSAEVVVPLVLEWINPKTLVDLGCGDGTWLSVFRGNGVENILGIDGNYISPEILQIPKECFIARDLSQPVLLDQRFDLAVSLEVAEHLPESSASEFVKSLVQLSDVVLFSAAIPHQGGTNHINEQWPDYWFNLFKDQGYLAVDLLRERIWNHPKVEPWYAQNSFLIVRSDRLDDYPALKNSFAHAHGLEQTIVHPKIYLSHFPDTPTHLSQSENAKPDIPQNIKITDVRLNPSAEIQTGDSLLIEISYQRMSPEKSAIFTLSLSDEVGNTYLDVDHTVEFLADDWTVPNTVSLKVERLDIVKGRYFIDSGVFSSDWTQIYDFHWHRYPLIITTSENHKGLLQPPMHWKDSESSVFV